MNNIFEEFGLSPKLVAAIEKLGFTKPTKIQEKSIPFIIQGKDVVGESATGSGKTLAFGCGIVEKVAPGQGLQSIILTPTRELAEQVKKDLEKLAQKSLKIISVYGGVSINDQIEKLKTANVVVATPGRLLDHLQRRTIDTSKVSVLVMDEADRMFDMGFIDDVEKIIRQCPKNRQTLFFSATISPRIKKLANKHMKNPVDVFATKMVDPAKLKQVYYDIPRNKKLSLLIHLLQKESRGLVMLFCNTRRSTDFIEKNLKKNKINAIAIHGGLSQNKRTKTIGLFNGAKVGVLVCTDVAARGLHIENVSHVYNYEIPNDPTDYVHRIGRTARAGESGKVVNLLADFDHDSFSRVVREHREFKISKIPTPQIKTVAANKMSDSRRPRSFGNGNRGRQSHRQPGRGRARQPQLSRSKFNS